MITESHHDGTRETTMPRGCGGTCPTTSFRSLTQSPDLVRTTMTFEVAAPLSLTKLCVLSLLMSGCRGFGVHTQHSKTMLLGAGPRGSCGGTPGSQESLQRRTDTTASTVRRVIPSLRTRPLGAGKVVGLEAILWDMDGVLADTERDGHRPAFNQVFAEWGLDTVWDEARYGKLLEVGGGKERMTAHWNEVGWPSSLPDDGTRQDQVKQLHLRKTAVFGELIRGGSIPLRPGVARLVDAAIESGVRLAVCSTSDAQAVTTLVETLLGPDRAGKFCIFAGDMVPKKKPAPDVYLLAVNEMNLDKSRCVVVEDSSIGLKAALAAGLRCVVTKSSYTAREDFTGADLVVDDLGDDPTTGVTLETLAGLLQVGA